MQSRHTRCCPVDDDHARKGEEQENDIRFDLLKSTQFNVGCVPLFPRVSRASSILTKKKAGTENHGLFGLAGFSQFHSMTYQGDCFFSPWAASFAVGYAAKIWPLQLHH